MSRKAGLMPLFLAVLAVIYSFGYFTHSAVPGNNPTYPLGWWGWFDQSMYLRAAKAFSAFDYDPSKHWYPPGFALLGAPFTRTMPGHPYFFVGLICLCITFLGFAAFARRLGVGRWWSFALFLVPLADRRLLDAWVIPWSTTPTAAIQWVLLATFAAHVTAKTCVPARAAGIGALAALVLVFRPTDIIASGLVLGLAALYDLITRRPRLTGPFAMAIGAGVVLVAFGALYLRIYGFHVSGYLAASREMGFYYGNLGFKAYTILIDPRAWFAVDPDRWHEGLFQRAPWLVLGLAGFGAAWFFVSAAQRWLLAALIAAAVLTTVNYLAYVDLLASGIWRYGNVHYLKWIYPGMALLGFLVLREIVVGRRILAGGAIVASVLICCWQVVPRIVPAGVAYRMAELVGPHAAGWPEAYFELPVLQDAIGPLQTVTAARAFPMTNGIRVLSIRRDFQGPLAWAPESGAGFGPIAAQTHYGAVATFGWPCFLIPRACPRANLTAPNAP